MSHPAIPTLETLGPIGLSGPVSEDALGLLRQPKRAAVLVYIALAAPEGYVRREELLEVFWPGSPEDNARNALRQSLAFIRSTLGRRVLRSRGRTAVGTSREHLGCDALEFKALLAAGARTDALALYRREFLSGFEIDAGPAFTAWVEARRLEYRELAYAASWELASAAEEANRPSAAAYWGKKALDLGPFDELRAQSLIALLHRVGDLTGALRTFRGLENYLAHNFGTRPSPESVRLVEQVRTRITAGEGPLTLHPNGRRTGLERRKTSDRRRVLLVWRNAERRQNERRHGERRSGTDRRDLTRI